jgi:hypothetical protein
MIGCGFKDSGFRIQKTYDRTLAVGKIKDRMP